MLYRKYGNPVEGELVLCTVTKIYPNSVFALLDEYDKQGMIHISEIAPGRIRNIRDYVTDGKKVICKVLKVDVEKGHIDLSLRRVNDGQRRQKSAEIKQEQLAEKIVELVAQQEKKDFKKLYNEITEKVFEKYETLYSFFEDYILNDIELREFISDKKLLVTLKENIEKRIRPPEVEIEGKLVLRTFKQDGVNLIKNVVKKMKEDSNLTIKYDGAGKYSVKLIADDYKSGEKVLKEKILDRIEELEDEGFEISFERKKD